MLDLARASIQLTVRTRLKRLVDYADVGEFLSNKHDGDLEGTTNAFMNTWTMARKASGRIKVEWSFEAEMPSIERENTAIRAPQRRHVCKLLKKSLAENRAKQLQELPSQGKAMECVKARTSC